MMKTNTKKCCIFLRVSSIQQDLLRQKTDITKYCKGNDFEIVGNPITAKISGLKEKRKDTQEIYNYFKSNFDVKYLIVSELSRLGRTQEVIEIIKTLASIGVCLISLKENIISLDDKGKINAATTLLISILSSINTFEVDTIRYRMQSGKAIKTQQGFYTGGFRLYGYDLEGDSKHRKYIINDKEAKVVKKIFEMFLHGKGTNTITKYLNLNSNKIPAKSGGLWSTQVVRYFLRNEKYTGNFEHQGNKLTIPAIISVDDFNQVQEHYKHTKKGTHTVNTYMLNTSKIICGVCGRNYYPTVNLKTYRNFYSCRSKKFASTGNTVACGNHNINKDVLEKLVLHTINNPISLGLIKTELNKNGITEQIEQLIEDIQTLEKELKLFDVNEANILRLAMNSKYTPEIIDKMIDELNAKRVENKNEILKKKSEKSKLEKLKIDKKSLVELFKNPENIDALKENLNKIIENIVILPYEKLKIVKKNDVAILVKIEPTFSKKGIFSFDYVVTRYGKEVYSCDALTGKITGKIDLKEM